MLINIFKLYLVDAGNYFDSFNRKNSTVLYQVNMMHKMSKIRFPISLFQEEIRKKIKYKFNCETFLHNIQGGYENGRNFEHKKNQIYQFFSSGNLIFSYFTEFYD